GGVPSANATHPVDAVLAALQIQSYMKEKAVLDPSAWKLRIGIHTGSLIAGVVGKKKFQYDVWGDTVNTASRMESGGAAGMINISGAAYSAVKNFFDTEYRGRISVKNKGDVDMYFVHGIRRELSRDTQGILPNSQFFELYSELQ
ncbi:MAG TPA: adenylate/guanylate cyclase domain-containing protein, partial [Leptospiraceae bacterium]|nr:adenylate/guanylate cyclase domain-containing protein [Leptospiraceae bacterium]